MIANKNECRPQGPIIWTYRSQSPRRLLLRLLAPTRPAPPAEGGHHRHHRHQPAPASRLSQPVGPPTPASPPSLPCHYFLNVHSCQIELVSVVVAEEEEEITGEDAREAVAVAVLRARPRSQRRRISWT